MDKFAEQPINVFMTDGSELPENFAEMLTAALAKALVRMRKLIVSLLVGVMVLMASPAQAADPYFDYYPTVRWPIARASYDAGPNIDIVLVGRRNLFGMRRVASYTDYRVAGLAIHKRRGVTCSDYPSATLCVRVFVRDYGRTGWIGKATINFYTKQRYILLNTSYIVNQRSVAHEFLHVLGMTHHAFYGVLGKGQGRYPSASEIAALNRSY